MTQAAEDFWFWHETDLPRCPKFGRYREESGHGGYERRLPSLTQTGNHPFGTPATRIPSQIRSRCFR
jgi:hypothetical protein